jgi:hypothetical protein
MVYPVGYGCFVEEGRIEKKGQVALADMGVVMVHQKIDGRDHPDGLGSACQPCPVRVYNKVLE